MNPDTVQLDAPAAPIQCGKCGKPVLLCVGGRCADCIADIGLNHPEAHAAWHAELRRRYEERNEQ